MKWEYDCEYLWQNVSDQENRNKEILNSYGLKGWELVSVDNGVAYFKRPVNGYDEDGLLKAKIVEAFHKKLR